MEFLHEAEEAVGLVMHENHRASNPDNDWLRDLFDEFVSTLQHGATFRIACFYEQQPTDLGLLLKGRVCYLVLFTAQPDRLAGKLHVRTGKTSRSPG
jgi:hypothetical protein